MSRRVAVRLAVTCLSPAPWSPRGQELAPWRLPSMEQGAGWGQQPCILLQGSQGDSKNAKKKNNKKTNKNKSSISRANKKKPSMPNVSNDLSQKLYATMEKHKEVRAGRAGRLGTEQGAGHSRAQPLGRQQEGLVLLFVGLMWLLPAPPGLLCDPPPCWARHQHAAPHR